MTQDSPPPDDSSKKPTELPAGIKKIGPNVYQIRVQSRDRRTGRKNSRDEQFTGTKRQAIDRQAALRAELRAGGSRPSRVQLRTFVATWLALRQSKLKPSVVRKYTSNLEHHILPALGDLYLDSILPSDVKAFVASKTGKLKPNTIINMVRLLRAIAKDALADGLCEMDWCARVETPTAPGYDEDKPNMLDAEQLGRLLAKIPSQWLPLVLLIAYTGMRWGEASALKWEDVDVAAGTIRIKRSNSQGEEVTPKTIGSRRPLPLPRKLLEFLHPKKKGLIFTVKKGDRAGQMFLGSPLREILTKACTAAGVPRITTHGLRRTFNNLSRQVADRQVVMAIIGHTTDAMHGHYSEVGMGEKQAAQEKVRRLVEGDQLELPGTEPPIAAVARAMFAAFHAADPDPKPVWEDQDDAERDRWIAAAIAARPELAPPPEPEAA